MNFTHTRTLEIAWGDCDPAGIVFHPRYFEWFDASVAALFAAATGLRKAEMTARYDAVGFPVVDIATLFHAPCRYGDVVRITSQVSEWKRSSFKLLQELHHGDTLAVTARSTRVWTGRDGDGRIRAVPLPAELVAAFNKKPEEPQP